MTTQSLIVRSINHNEIVSSEWTAERESDLYAECEDSVVASDTLLEFWGTDYVGDHWRVHLTGEREPINSLKSIRVVSSSDAGCDWTEQEQADFCAAVVTCLSDAYPGVDVECEVGGLETKVFVYGRQKPAGLVTYPEQEADLIDTIKAAVQDVWEDGSFWGPVERDERGMIVHADD